MTIFETVRGTVNTAVDTISSVAQTLVDKNRTNAKLNRLRLIMKSESELMNRAYIALGKTYYDSEKKGVTVSDAEREKLFNVIEASKAKIAKARECYRKIVDSQNDIFYGPAETPEYNSSEIVDITVACSNENEYESSPFDNTAIQEDIVFSETTTPSDEPTEDTVNENAVTEEAVTEVSKDKLSDLKDELNSKKMAGESFLSDDEGSVEDSETVEDELF